MTETDPAAWVAAGRELAQAATPGPWQAGPPRTYDETRRILAGNQVLAHYVPDPDAAWAIDARTRLPAALDTIDAVLALHRRGRQFLEDGSERWLCDHDFAHWPCPTVRAITEAIERGRA